MLQHITVLGRYTGTDKRGIVVGGIPFTPGMNPKRTRVNEETFLKLLKGVENGWFEITEHDYEKYVTSRYRKVKPIKFNAVTPSVEETPVVEETPAVEETPVVEETPAEEKPAPKKKTSRKKVEKVEE